MGSRIALVEQIALLAHYLDDWIFVIDDDDTPERCWPTEQGALAELLAEGWKVAAGSCRIEPDVPAFAGRKIIGCKPVRNIQYGLLPQGFTGAIGDRLLLGEALLAPMVALVPTATLEPLTVILKRA
jgi:hypothetical protein